MARGLQCQLEVLDGLSRKIPEGSNNPLCGHPVRSSVAFDELDVAICLVAPAFRGDSHVHVPYLRYAVNNPSNITFIGRRIIFVVSTGQYPILRKTL